jgi:DNA mismatch endonuclease (patch repair protein)
VQASYNRGVNKNQLTKEHRSWNMSRIRGKNTGPEMRVRSLLHRMGYRFRLHARIPISGSAAVSKTSRSTDEMKRRLTISKAVEHNVTAAAGAHAHSRAPRAVSVDILLPKYKTAIFVHGCFWHRHAGCRNCTTPTNRREWWLAKLNGNAARDKLHQAALRKLGWRVMVIWECETESEKGMERFIRGVAERRRDGSRGFQATVQSRQADSSRSDD